MNKKPSVLSRREFLKYSAAAATSVALADLTGCISLPARELPDIDKNKGIILKNGSVIDVVNNKVVPNGTVAVERGRIISITGPGEQPVPENGYEVIDLGGCYLLPGLIDAHCHSTMPSAGELNPCSARAALLQIQRNYFQHIESGTTTIRDMGAFPESLHGYIKEIENGKMTGPRVIHCNSIFNIKGGHPDIDPSDISIFSGVLSFFSGEVSTYYTDRKNMVKKLNENIRHGASFIKLTLDNISLMCGKDMLKIYSDDDMRYIMDFAAEHSLPVSAHVHRKFGFDRALKYGINSLEHTICDAVISNDEIKQMAEKNIAIVPTMVIAQMLAADEAFDSLPAEYNTPFIKNELKIRRDFIHNPQERFIVPEIHSRNRESLKFYKEFGCENLYKNRKFMANPDIYFRILKYGPDNIKRMHSAGITIGAGTDGGVPFSYNGTISRELEILSRTGFKNTELVRFATINNAKILRMHDKIGSIEKGKFADFAIVRENPYENIEALRSPEAVIKEGKIVFTKNPVKKTENTISI